MSHLTPHRSVRITPGGGAAITATPAGQAAAPDTSWGGLIADLAAALDLEPEAAQLFTTKVDEVVDALAGDGGAGREVARTRVRAALLGNVGMIEDLAPVGLSDQAVDQLLDSWGGSEHESDRVLARLALMHDGLVAPFPPESDDTVGEGGGGSAAPLPGPVIGQVAYTLDSVPKTAKGVAAWIDLGDTPDDRRARAQAAQEVEQERDEQRVTVVNAIAGVLDG